MARKSPRYEHRIEREIRVLDDRLARCGFGIRRLCLRARRDALLALLVR